MPEEPTIEEQGRTELAKIAKSVGRLYRRLRVMQTWLPETPEDHPLMPNTLSAVCEEVAEYYLLPAVERLKLMVELSEQELLQRKRDWQVCISLTIAAVSRLPPEYLFAAASRLMSMPPIDFFKAVLWLRQEADDRFVDGMLGRGGEGRPGD